MILSAERLRKAEPLPKVANKAVHMILEKQYRNQGKRTVPRRKFKREDRVKKVGRVVRAPSRGCDCPGGRHARWPVRAC
jgi:hypothetical protein